MGARSQIGSLRWCFPAFQFYHVSWLMIGDILRCSCEPIVMYWYICMFLLFPFLSCFGFQALLFRAFCISLLAIGCYPRSLSACFCRLMFITMFGCCHRLYFFLRFICLTCVLVCLPCALVLFWLLYDLRPLRFFSGDMFSFSMYGAARLCISYESAPIAGGIGK